MSYKPNRRFDVGVIGGGPAGLTVAYVLACLGLEVLVLEASPCPQQKAGECLPPSAADLLQRLGLLSVLQGQGRCYGIRSIWGSDTPVERNYLFHPYGPGWLLDRRQFEQSMAEHAEKRGVELAWGSVFEEAVKTKTGWSLAWNSETQEVRFIIDASGRNARFSRRQGATFLRCDRLVGWMHRYRLRSGAPPEQVTLIEAVENGWWYSTPVSGNSLVVGFFTDSDLSPVRGTAGWRSISLPAYTSERLENTDAVVESDLLVRSARTARLNPPLGNQWLAVGDAAVAFDPLSSYGIQTAISTGFYGAHAVHDLMEGDADAAGAYRFILGELFEKGTVPLRSLYAAETRWPQSPFWMRRHLAPPE